jgi:transposase InsO family protein
MNSTLADWKLEDNMIFYKGKCYVPNDLELRRKIVQNYHDTLSAGHPGQLRTQELVQKNYWWPGLPTFVRNYVTGCAICQQHKINRHPINPPLLPIKSEHMRPFSLMTMDFITDLPISEGFDSIMVVVDHGSSKGVILEPCHKTIDAAGTAKILLDSLYKRYGLPDKAISDRGPQFASHVFRELGRLLGIKLAMSTAHHPQTDGATERTNQEIEAYLSIFCANNPETWRQLLPTLEFSYNTKPHATQKESPFFLQMGYDPIAIPTAYPKTNVPESQERLIALQEARKEAQAAHELARQKMMERITRGFHTFNKGDKVWLESKHLKLRYESKKMAPKREGPFTISEVLSPLTYRLDLPKTWRIHPVIHITLLSPYRDNEIHGENFTQPPPDLIEGQPEYEVESILSHRRHGRKYAYLIKWKGYATAENTWEPESNLNNAKESLTVYKLRHRLQ